jgi:tellurite methyltransferase
LIRDKEKWDSRYSAKARRVPDADSLLTGYSSFLSSGIALDLASGRGGNALFLAGRGYAVHALDISIGALSILQEEACRRRLDVQCIVADLDYFPLPGATYDVGTVFYFFDEALIPGIRACLKDGGLLFYATYNHRHLVVRPEFNPDYLVDAHKFPQLFKDFDILIHDPRAGDAGNVSRVVCRKPA